MNIIFFASSKFAAPSLKNLIISGQQVSCVVTQPDKLKGRGLHLEGTVIKAVAQEYNLPIYQPQNPNSVEAVKFLKNLKPDLFILISYGQILSQQILDIPKIFSVNVHASLLPRYRGAAPINWAIINGDLSTGITVMKMVQKMDAGPIILKEKVNILDSDDAVTLGERLSQIAAKALLDALKSIKSNEFILTEQEGVVTLAPKLKKEDGRIDFNRSSLEIYNLVRGLINWPGAFTYYKGKLLKIFEVGLGSGNVVAQKPAGEIVAVSREGIVVATGKGELIITKLQIEGKRKMDVNEFISGHKICVGDGLGEKK